ncbi:hypothetical protein [Parafrankia elaeagni]|uniref:hypothetical protein n=1 Tax=Parafrankia elaeagni TaxID=222534 RepID=UPI0012B60646|nr:hypothetical protein [Parafrankia elaeagni]
MPSFVLAALVLSNASLFVILLIRLAEENREAADRRRLEEMWRRKENATPTR